MSDVTRILETAQQGDPTAAEELFPLVDEESTAGSYQDGVTTSRASDPSDSASGESS